MESLIGKTVDSYKILEVIGRGGMGVVFKALDTNLEKIVALKMIDPFLARDEGFVRRFKTEAKALARLENPNIVRVYALRETPSGFFMVMEYVENKPLSIHIQENGPLSIKQTVSITKQLLSAVGHAHSVGVIHRDIKPSNILLCNDGRIKVSDFGLAKVIQQKGPASTVTQTRAGTLYYMSPEQVKGLKNVDKRSDLYSLGMTVYEMLVGRVPFEKTDSDFTIQKKIVDGQIPSPMKFDANIPKKLAKIILKSIDKEPDKRYQEADEMMKELNEYEVEIEPKVKPGKPVVPKKQIPKKPIIIFSIAAFIISLIIIYLLLVPPSDEIGTPQKSYISIATDPADVQIKINDEIIDKSLLPKVELEEEGEINLQATKDGYNSIDTSIIIRYGEEINLALILTPLAKPVETEKLNIDTNPKLAKVYLDQKPIGESPIKNYNAEIGQYNLRIEKVGFVSKDTIVTVQKGKENSFAFVLTKVTEKGNLKITSDPSAAEVWLNKEKVGTTPFEKLNLAAGTYQLVIRMKGYKDYPKSVTVSANKTTEIPTIKLTQVERLTVTSETAGAEILIDGKSYGSKKFDEYVALGEYKIKIRKDGFETYEEKIKIEANKPKVISKKLEPITASQFGTLAVTSDPADAEIFIDDNKNSIGKTNLQNYKINVGEHKITIRKSGYKEFKQTVKVEADKPTIVNAPLIPLMGEVKIRALPWGDIYIDDKEEKLGSSAFVHKKLPTGEHKLRIVHTLGKWEKTINIDDESTKEYLIDFSRVVKLTILSNPTNAEILINGDPTEFTTPKMLDLRPGSHTIQVKKDGYYRSTKPYTVSKDIYESKTDKEDKIMLEMTKIE